LKYSAYTLSEPIPKISKPWVLHQTKYTGNHLHWMAIAGVYQYKAGHNLSKLGGNPYKAGDNLSKAGGNLFKQVAICTKMDK
jgi:hypothetical protein